MITLTLHVMFENYIAHPYWPEKNTVIEVEKKSGMNRCKSDKTRDQALNAQLKKMDLSIKEYQRLKELAARPWYTLENGKICIPRHQLAGAFVQLVSTAPKALRGEFTKDNFRALVQIGDLETQQSEGSGVFARFVKLADSNQRSWQENEYLGRYLDKGKPFAATGKIGVMDEKQVKTVKAIIEATIETVGVGAARKMGFGRGVVKSIK